MVLVPDTEFGFLLGDNSSELISLSPGQLNGFPLGVLTLGGNDTVQGSIDSELILANQDDDIVLGGGGIDTIFGGKNNDSLDGQDGNDQLFGNLGSDTLIGGNGDDSLFGGRDNDQLIGGSGNDTLYGDLGADTITGGAGADIFGLRENGQGTDVITDFQDGVDLLQIPDGVGEIRVESNGANLTQISVVATGEVLVQLQGIEATAINLDDLIGSFSFSGSTDTSDNLIDQVVELTNDFRGENGLSPLSFDSQLANAAQIHTENMAFQDFFSHDGIDGSDVGDRVLDAGYSFSRAGENIAAGYTTAESVVQGWIDSPGHRANLLNPDYTEIGVGYFFLENDTGESNWNHYWTQVFGTP
ncbi:MAG: CAP domain-containing protein [Cyanobacteriota bacterium]|nr:CAP domain-containing protein [Cyanobacteriota bacterium]